MPNEFISRGEMSGQKTVNIPIQLVDIGPVNYIKHVSLTFCFNISEVLNLVLLGKNRNSL